MFSSVRMRHLGRNINRIQNKRSLWQMLRETLKGSYKMSSLTICLLVLMVAYIVFPFDLLPDYIPFLGWIDDGLVFYLMVMRLNSETNRYLRHKAISRKAERHY